MKLAAAVPGMSSLGQRPFLLQLLDSLQAHHDQDSRTQTAGLGSVKAGAGVSLGSSCSGMGLFSELCVRALWVFPLVEKRTRQARSKPGQMQAGERKHTLVLGRFCCLILAPGAVKI